MDPLSMPSEELDAILGLDIYFPTDAKTVEAQASSLSSLLEQLTPKQRFVIERAWGLHDGCEYSFREIADSMGVDYRAVWQHYHAGMGRMRNIIS